MRKQLLRWLTLLGSSCGAAVHAALARIEVTPAPTIYFHLCSDAMHESTMAGLGGFCHGAYWSFVVPVELLPVLSIPILEFLGVVFNFLVFAPTMRRLLQGNPNARFVFRTDALTAALTLPAESQRSELLVAAYQWLRERPEFIELAPHCLIAHLFGDGNPYSDSLSRQRWEEFFGRCKQIGVKPIRTHLPPSTREVFEHVVRVSQMRALVAGGLSERLFGEQAVGGAPTPAENPRPSSGLLQREVGSDSLLRRRFGHGSQPPTALPASPMGPR